MKRTHRRIVFIDILLLALTLVAVLLITVKDTYQQKPKPSAKPVNKVDPYWHAYKISVSPDGAIAAVQWKKIDQSTKNGNSVERFKIALYQIPSGKRIGKAVPAYRASIEAGYLANAVQNTCSPSFIIAFLGTVGFTVVILSAHLLSKT